VDVLVYLWDRQDWIVPAEFFHSKLAQLVSTLLNSLLNATGFPRHNSEVAQVLSLAVYQFEVVVWYIASVSEKRDRVVYLDWLVDDCWDLVTVWDDKWGFLKSVRTSNRWFWSLAQLCLRSNETVWNRRCSNRSWWCLTFKVIRVGQLSGTELACVIFRSIEEFLVRKMSIFVIFWVSYLKVWNPCHFCVDISLNWHPRIIRHSRSFNFVLLIRINSSLWSIELFLALPIAFAKVSLHKQTLGKNEVTLKYGWFLWLNFDECSWCLWSHPSLEVKRPSSDWLLTMRLIVSLSPWLSL
jgi:hypothetical protein